MITRDFILLQIQQLVAVLARVLLLRGTGQHEQVLIEIRLGLSTNELGPALHHDISREKLINLCSDESGFSAEKGLSLADLLREKGYSEHKVGLEEWRHSLLHALWLYETIGALPNSIIPLDLDQRIDDLREDIALPLTES